MNIRYIKNKDIDKEKWNHCIESSSNGTLYAMSWYLDVASDYWDALISGDYEVVFPLTYTRKLGFKILRQPGSSQQLGIFSKEILSQEAMIKFLEAIPKSFLFGSLHLNAGNKISATKKFPIEYRVNIELDLTPSIEQLREDYSSSNKRNLKRIRRENILVKKGVDYKRVVDVFSDNKGKDYQVHENSYAITHKVFDVLLKRGILTVYDAYDEEGVFMAGLVTSVFKDKMYLLYAGSTAKSYKVYANHLLYDYVIEEASKSKSILDFEGTNSKSLAFVYHGFGGKTVPYPVVTISNVPKILVKWIELLRKSC